VDMLHGHGTHPQLVAVLRLAMSMERFGDGDDPLIYWNDLCALLDQLESSLNERSVRQFGAAMTNKAQVAYIMYSLVGDALESAAQRLTGQAGLLRTLVEHSGVFILQYGPDRLVEELNALSTAQHIQTAWVLIVPAWIPYPAGWARTRLEDDGKSALFAKKLQLASAFSIGDKPAKETPKDDTRNATVTFESMDKDGDGTVTKEEWAAAHGGRETVVHGGEESAAVAPAPAAAAARFPSDLLGAWGNIPAWSPTTAWERTLTIEIDSPQETSPTVPSSPTAKLMQMEIQRQKHINNACEFLVRKQSPQGNVSIELQDADRSRTSNDPELVGLPGIPMWLDDVEMKELPQTPITSSLTPGEEQEIGDLLDELELSQAQLTQNPLHQMLSESAACAASGTAWNLDNDIEAMELFVTDAKEAAIEVFAGVVVFVTLHRQFIRWKANMVAHAGKWAHAPKGRERRLKKK